MKKQIIPFISLLAVLTLPGSVYAADPTSTPEYVDPTEATITLTAPAANAVVSSIFTVSGTVNPVCPMSDSVYIEDNVDSGSDNYKAPYDAKAHHSYSVVAPLTISGNTFTYSVDLSKAFWNSYSDNGPSLVPQVPQPGKARIFVNTDFNNSPDHNCYGYANREVTVQYPQVVQPTKAQVPKPVPSALVKPSPSPSIAVKPVPSADVKDASNTISPWWVVLAFLIGGALVGLAEYSAISYQKTHKPKKK